MQFHRDVFYQLWGLGVERRFCKILQTCYVRAYRTVQGERICETRVQPSLAGSGKTIMSQPNFYSLFIWDGRETPCRMLKKTAFSPTQPRHAKTRRCHKQGRNE